MHQVPNEVMKRMAMLPPPPSSSSMSNLPPVNNSLPSQDLLWISKHQQQHPSTHAHPLKNTIRVNSRGLRYKFDGKQWRPLCMSPDGYECRNLAFRSSLCQKHFYKVHQFKRPYAKPNAILPPQQQQQQQQVTGNPPFALKRSLPSEFDHHHQQHHHHPNEPVNQKQKVDHELEETYDDDDDSIEVIEDNDVSRTIRRKAEARRIEKCLTTMCC